MTIYLIIAACLAVAGIALGLYRHGGHVAELKISAVENATVGKIVEKKDEIRNNPPSVDAVIDSLHSGTF